MNNNFLQKGMPFEMSSAKDILPNLKRLINKCRSLDVPIIYFTQAYRLDGSNLGLAGALSNLEYPPKGFVAGEGTLGVKIFDELKPLKKDILIKKSRYSGFYATDLEPILRQLDCDTLLITGVVTDCCVNATAFDAFQRNFKVIVISDCTSARSEEAHKITLKTISRVIGEVSNHLVIIERLDKGINRPIYEN